MEFTMQLRSTTYRKKKRRQRHLLKPDSCLCVFRELGTLKYPSIWNELRKNRQLCDGKVHCVDGTTFHIHRAILSAASYYFRVLFTNSINRGQAETHEANVNAPSKIFDMLLDYAYTGTCQIDQSTVQSLIQYADQYDILGVVQMCCTFLIEQMSATNCFSIRQLADEYFCQDLFKKVEKYIRSNFVQILQQNPDYVNIDKEQLMAILYDDQLNVKNEVVVFDAILKWVNYKPQLRSQYLPKLLQCVRLGLIPDCLRHILKHPLIEENSTCQDYLHDIFEKCGHEIIARKPNIDNMILRPRISYDVLFAIGGWTAGSPTNFVETYDVRAGRWLLSSHTDQSPRAYHGLCTLNSMIYVLGGFDGSQYFNTVCKFDPVGHVWSECACMHFQRCYVSVVMHGGMIYAMGGYNGRTRMNTVERYDPERNQWEMIASMQKQRSDASATVLRDKIYIAGGFNGHEVMRSVEVFDTKQNQWSYIPQMNSPRSGVSLVAHNDSLYALGGFNGYERLISGERYIPGESTWWEDISEMKTPRSNFATTILDDYIYVIGGFDGNTTINMVEYYDPETDEWFDAPCMNLNRSALCACVISGLPNTLDYSSLGKSQEERGQGAISRVKNVQGCTWFGIVVLMCLPTIYPTSEIFFRRVATAFL